MSWSIDGVEWNYPCKIERVSEVAASDISGLMLDKTFFNDVIGTYLKYTVAIAVPTGSENDYVDIYESLTAPVNYHEFNFPYNYNTNGVTFYGRVQNVEDTYVRVNGGKQTWRKTTFDAVAVNPSKVNEDGSIENYGLSPYPEDTEAVVGDLYEYTAYGWVQRNYGDADETEY